jgi:hypothetical protein
MVHYGRAQEVITARKEVLRAAYQKHPERFVLKEPSPQPLPEAVWINPPKAATSDGKLHKIQSAGVSKPLTDSDVACEQRRATASSSRTFCYTTEKVKLPAHRAELQKPKDLRGVYSHVAV